MHQNLKFLKLESNNGKWSEKSIAAFISEGTTIADTTSSDINLGTSGTNIATM